MSAVSTRPLAARANPFDPDDDAACGRWRARKLAAYPADTAALVVEIADPRAITAAEKAALVDCRRAGLNLRLRIAGRKRNSACAGSATRPCHLDRNYWPTTTA
jgi:hypothetical protein